MSSKFNIFTVLVPAELQQKSTVSGDGDQAVLIRKVSLAEIDHEKMITKW